MQNTGDRAIAQGEELELSPEAVRVLVGARQLLQRGWIQGRAALPDRSAFCLMGALSEGGGGRPGGLIGERWFALVAVLNDACGNIAQIWNDTPGRTQEDVLRLLDGILARVRK